MIRAQRRIVRPQAFAVLAPPTNLTKGREERQRSGDQRYRGGLTLAGSEVSGGRGAARPAVTDPRPSFCRLKASSLPEGFRLCAAWKRFMASTVPASHLPVGLAA